jgi:hypothetical protein
MTTAVDKWPASARLLAVAPAGHLPAAPTPLPGTRPLQSVLQRELPTTLHTLVAKGALQGTNIQPLEQLAPHRRCGNLVAADPDGFQCLAAQPRPQRTIPTGLAGRTATRQPRSAEDWPADSALSIAPMVRHRRQRQP